MTTNAINNSQLLEAMRPNGYKRIFVIGSFDARITFYSQQCRALELIYALFHEGYLDSNSNLGVIGGGAAGITAAYAAAIKGCNVSCFEKKGIIFSLQNNSNRYLHPNIYDWPNQDSENPDACLPILNWSADQASNVVKKLRKEINNFQKDNPERLRIHPKIVHNIKEIENLNKVWFTSSDLEVDDRFDVAIIAIGFGLERNNYDIHSEYYWNNDSLDGYAQDEQEKILISGSGDGGLIDVARAALQEFNHSEIIKRVIKCPKMREFAERINDIDNENALDISQQDSRYKKYQEIPLPIEEISKYLQNRVRKNREIWLNVQSNDVWSSNSSILNRLITHILIKNKNVRLLVGELKDIQRKSEKSFNIIVDGKMFTDYSRVVIRHGADVVGHFKKTFNSNEPFRDACIRDLNGKIKNLNLTGTLNNDVSAWYGGLYSSTYSFKTGSKTALTYRKEKPWLIVRESLREDVFNKLSNLFCCSYIYPHTIRSIEEPLKGGMVIPNLTQHLKTNNTDFSKYHLQMEKIISSREELSSSTDIQSFFVPSKSFPTLFNYLANINNNIGETAILCGEKGSGKSISLHHALQKNSEIFEKNKVIVIVSDIHILYQFWEKYKAETSNTRVIDYNNFTFLFDLCNALNGSDNQANKLLENINAKDITISDYPQSRNNPDSFKEPGPPLLKILEEIKGAIKKKNYSGANEDYLHLEVLPSALNVSSNKFLLRKWSSVVNTIFKSLIDNNYKILRVIDNADSLHINVPKSIKYYEDTLIQLRDFVQSRPGRNYSHFLVTRQRTSTDVLNEQAIIAGSNRCSPTQISHEPANMKKILNKRINLFNGVVSSNGKNLYDLILNIIINDERQNLEKIYHNNCRSYLANVEAWIAQAYYRIHQLGYPTNKNIDIEEQVKHFRIRNLYLNGRLYLKTEDHWNTLNTEPGVWMYNLFFYPIHTNQITNPTEWKGLCLIRILQILKSVIACSYSDLKGYLKLGFRYEEELIQSHLINARAFGLIDSTSNDKDVLYEISEKGIIACHYVLSDIDTLYYFALDSAVPKILVDNKFIRSHDNHIKVRTNYPSSVVISAITFLLFLGIVSYEEQKYYKQQEKRLRDSFNFMINPSLIQIFNDITVKEIESRIEEIYYSADVEEKKTIEGTIKELINFAN